VPAGSAERRCAAIVAELGIPEPFSLGQFLSRLAARRQRMIFLHPFDSWPGKPCGLWIGTARADHIFHERGTTPWHRTQITLHEVAHMLLGHAGGTQAPDDLVRLLAPDVDPALVRMVLGRSAYSTAGEQEAETLASLILGQARPAPSRNLEIAVLRRPARRLLKRTGSWPGRPGARMTGGKAGPCPAAESVHDR
jgi:hypothetical protein